LLSLLCHMKIMLQEHTDLMCTENLAMYTTVSVALTS
jgi:hypothetical protein